MPRLPVPIYRLVRRKGRHCWYLRWTEGGGSQEISTGERARPAAEAFAAKYTRERREPDSDLAGVIDGYVASRIHKASYQHLLSHARLLKARLAALGCTHVADVTPQVIADYITGRGDKITSCRRELELFRAATGIKVQKPNRRPAKVRAIDREAAGRLLAASRGHLQLFIRLALSTGRRTGAILDLTWDRVDFARGVIDFRNPDKGESNKRRGFSPMDRDTKKALRKAKAWAESDHVIEYAGKPVTDIRKAWWWAMKRAGLGTGRGRAFRPAFSPHALKHSAISWLAENDWSADKISDLTDTDPKTVRLIYRRVNPGALRDMAEDLGSVLRTVYGSGGRKQPTFSTRSGR